MDDQTKGPSVTWLALAAVPYALLVAALTAVVAQVVGTALGTLLLVPTGGIRTVLVVVQLVFYSWQGERVVRWVYPRWCWYVKGER